MPPRIDAVGQCRQRARQALARRARGERADEVLARDRQQQRTLQLVQTAQLHEQLCGLGRRLGEVGPGIDDQLLPLDARGDRRGYALAQKGEHLRGDVAVALGVPQPPPGRRERVHDHQRGSGLGAHLRQPRVAQAAGVVDDDRARRDRRARDRRLVRVRRDDRPELARRVLD